MFHFLAYVTLRMKPYVCADIRNYIYKIVHMTHCTRCGTLVKDSHHIRACFVRGDCICFTCYHRNRWPT